MDLGSIIDTFINGYGVLNTSDGGGMQIGSVVWDTNRAIDYASKIEKAGDTLKIRLSWTKNLTISNYKVTVEYTKTTD